MNNTSETWADINGYFGLYQISNFGRVKRLEKCIVRKGFECILPEKILKQKINTNGYLSIGLTNNKKRSTVNVHRLVALSFIPNVYNQPAINHKDGNKHNNLATNLEWCSFSENSRHAKSIGLKKDVFGESHGMTKLLNGDVIDIRNKAMSGMSGADISKLYPSVCYATIRNIINRKTWVNI